MPKAEGHCTYVCPSRGSLLQELRPGWQLGHKGEATVAPYWKRAEPTRWMEEKATQGPRNSSQATRLLRGGQCCPASLSQDQAKGQRASGSGLQRARP